MLIYEPSHTKFESPCFILPFEKLNNLCLIIKCYGGDMIGLKVCVPKIVCGCLMPQATLMISISVCYSSELCSAITILNENVIFYQAKSFMFYNV